MDDVHVVDYHIQSLVEMLEDKDRKKKEIECYTRAIDVILLRHRLTEAAWETEILAKLDGFCRLFFCLFKCIQTVTVTPSIAYVSTDFLI